MKTNFALPTTSCVAVGGDIDRHLGRQLRRRRRLLELSQRAVAQACGVAFQQIQKYETGSNRLSAARLWQLSAVLDVPVDYFFQGLPRGETRARAAQQVGDMDEIQE